MSLLVFLLWLSILEFWLHGSLDAYIAKIPKSDGDATPLGQRPLSVLWWSWVG